MDPNKFEEVQRKLRRMNALYASSIAITDGKKEEIVEMAQEFFCFSVQLCGVDVMAAYRELGGIIEEGLKVQKQVQAELDLKRAQERAAAVKPENMN